MENTRTEGGVKLVSQAKSHWIRDFTNSTVNPLTT